jgi:putative FmdB family regulatory protein
VPTYQYACTECGERLEAVQSFSDPALTECPNCQGKLRKVFNSVGIVFKGSGFYRNDSRPAASGSTTESKNETKSESKSTDAKSPSSSSDSGSSSTSASSTSSTSSTSSGTSSGAKAGAASSS